uniref:Uncharacterized protein n=1 Tax=Aegilops tauschii subsp. strangulata TaxID=200361 RepID=A0A453I307_AEGTS
STSLPDLREIDLDLTPSSSARDRVRSGQGLVGATSLFPPGFRPNRRSPPVVYSCRRRPPALSACPLRASALKLGRRCASAPPVAAARFHDIGRLGIAYRVMLEARPIIIIMKWLHDIGVCAARGLPAPCSC